MMVQAVSALAMSAAPVWAEVVACDIDGDPLTFAIDRSQFSPPVDVNDPPRQAATVVQFGDKRFPATPFLIGDTRGFEAEGHDGTTTLFVIQSDGTAILSDRLVGLRVTGTCTIREDEQ
jgi:hypothetical protein